MAYKLTDNIPLRTSDVLGSYAQRETLPHVYGRCTLSPVRYDATGHLWLLADHPIQGVDRVEFEGREIASWIVQQSTDPTGTPVAVLETEAQVEDASDLRITLRGKRHPTTGELLDRPDLILWDVLANLAGLPISQSDLDDLRADCQSAGIRLAGKLDDHETSIQTWVDRICQGSGIAWSRQASGIALLWPADPAANPEITLALRDMPAIAPEADQSDLATVLELAYDYDYARSDYRGTLRLAAPDAIERYGEIETRREMGWLHDARSALAAGSRLLAYLARPLWRWQADVPAKGLSVGDTVGISHPHSPVSDALVVAVEQGDVDERITLQAAYGSAPSVSLASVRAGTDPDALETPEYRYGEGMATILITDPEGNPLPGARVTLDGKTTRTTDSRGWVQFPADSGNHTLRVYASGFDPYDLPLLIP